MKMIKTILLILWAIACYAFFIHLAHASDDLISDGTSGNWQLIDNSGNRWRAKIAYTTNGNGDVVTMGGLLASGDNVLGVNPSSNRTLIANDGKRWSASVFYTTDGNGNVIPITGGGGGGGVSAVFGSAPVVSSGGATPTISMAAATNSVNGYLTSADHTAFAAKMNVRVVGTVSVGTTLATLNSDRIVNVDTSGGGVTIVLPDAVASAGWCADIKNLNSNTVTINPPGGQTIDGLASDSLSVQNESAHLCAVGGNWFNY